jgi:hypothetical protein
MRAVQPLIYNMVGQVTTGIVGSGVKHHNPNHTLSVILL